MSLRKDVVFLDSIHNLVKKEEFDEYAIPITQRYRTDIERDTVLKLIAIGVRLEHIFKAMAIVDRIVNQSKLDHHEVLNLTAPFFQLNQIRDSGTSCRPPFTTNSTIKA